MIVCKFYTQFLAAKHETFVKQQLCQYMGSIDTLIVCFRCFEHLMKHQSGGAEA